MSVQAMTWVLEETDLPPAPKLLMVSLANHSSGDGGSCYPGQELLARETSMSERTVRRWLGWLEKHRWIQRAARMREDGRGRTSDSYQIVGWRRHPDYAPPTQCDTLNCDHPDSLADYSDQPDTLNQRDQPDSGDRTNRTVTTDQPDTAVQGTVREPSVDPSARSGTTYPHGGKPPEGEGKTRRQLLFEEICKACGIDWSNGMTSDQRGRVNAAAKQLDVDVGADPPEVRRRADRYHELYPDAALTPQALTGNWGQLTRDAVEAKRAGDGNGWTGADYRRAAEQMRASR